MYNIANIRNINILTIDVSEKINDKNLKDFVKSSLLLNEQVYKENDNIFALYIEENSSYEIIVMDSDFTHLIAEIFIINYINKETNSIDLYLCDDLFCIYKNSNLYYVQKIDYEFEFDELLTYIDKNLKLKIDNYERVDSLKVDELKTKFMQENLKSNLKNINLSVNYNFKIYLLYLFVIFAFSLYYLSSLNVNPQKSYTSNNSFKINELKKKYLYKYFGDEFSDLLSKTKKYKLKLEIVDYTNKYFKIVLLSSKKENLYSFLLEYKKRILENSINYIEASKNYECSLNVRAIRK